MPSTTPRTIVAASEGADQKRVVGARNYLGKHAAAELVGAKESDAAPRQVSTVGTNVEMMLIEFWL